jgi:mono/diheme cytochrome c family protein
MIMPSEEFARWTDDDAAGGAAILQLPLPVRVLYGLGVLRDAAEKIDHTLPPALPVAEGITVEHGPYVVQGCRGCHGPDLLGGKIPGGPPDWPAAAKLAPGAGSAMPTYADARAFKAMPFAALSQINDVDAEAMFLYLKSLPAQPESKR